MQMTTRRFLHDIVAEVFALPKHKVIWSNQTGVKQAAPFVSLMAYSHQAEAMEDRLPTGISGVLNLKVPTAFVLQVRYFGDPDSYPVDIVDHFVRCLEKPSVVDACFQNGVAFLYADPVQDITALLENRQQFEPAAAVDLHCRFTSSVTDDVGCIEGVEISGDYDPDPQGKGTGQLIYGHIADDGTVTDLDHAIPVDVSINISDD